MTHNQLIQRAKNQISAEQELLSATELSRAVSRRLGDHDAADMLEAAMAQEAAESLKRIDDALAHDRAPGASPEQIQKRTIDLTKETHLAAACRNLQLHTKDDGTFELLDDEGRSHYG